MCLTTGSSKAAHLPGSPWGASGSTCAELSPSPGTKFLTLSVPVENVGDTGKLCCLSWGPEVPLYWQMGPEMCDPVLYVQHIRSSVLAVMEMENSGPDRPQENLWGSLARSVSPPLSWLDSSLLVQLITPLSDIHPQHAVECLSAVSVSFPRRSLLKKKLIFCGYCSSSVSPGPRQVLHRCVLKD